MPGKAFYKDQEFLESLLMAVLNDVFAFLAVIKKDTREIIFVNALGPSLFEYESADELLGKFAPSLRKNTLDALGIKKMDETIEKKGYYFEEVEYKTKTGKIFWGLLQLYAFTQSGTQYLLAHIEKIDRAKIAEEKLAKEKQRFVALMDYASIGMLIVNRQEEIILVNPYAVQLFGYKAEELIGKNISILIPSRFHVNHKQHHLHYFSQPENRPMGQGMDLFARRKNGTEFPVEVSLGTYKIEDDMYAIAFVSDISTRKKAEQEYLQLNTSLELKIKQRTDELAEYISKLQQQVKETEEAEAELRKSLDREKELGELKSRFVTMASHEFRTPLSTILSSAFLVQKYTQAEEQTKREKHVERIISSVNSLTDILNDFLNVGKIEEGKIEPKFSLFNIDICITGAINEIKAMQKKGQQINYSHKGYKEVWLDPSLIKHITLNLISNAIKFSPEDAKIEVETSVKNHLLTMRVKDKGIGISKQDQKHLFERFFRGTNATNIQGTGLGLHIVQNYVKLMHGEIECLSELDRGTEFIIRMNIQK